MNEDTSRMDAAWGELPQHLFIIDTPVQSERAERLAGTAFGLAEECGLRVEWVAAYDVLGEPDNILKLGVEPPPTEGDLIKQWEAVNVFREKLEALQFARGGDVHRLTVELPVGSEDGPWPGPRHEEVRAFCLLSVPLWETQVHLPSMTTEALAAVSSRLGVSWEQYVVATALEWARDHLRIQTSEAAIVRAYSVFGVRRDEVCMAELAASAYESLWELIQTLRSEANKIIGAASPESRYTVNTTTYPVAGWHVAGRRGARALPG